MNSGSILRNNNNTSQTKLGGAIHNAGVFNLSGGKVETCESIQGGGVYNTGTSNLRGGTIDSNKGEGKGIYVQSGKVNLSGDIKVTDGIFTKVKPRNVLNIVKALVASSVITIEGSQTEGQMDKGTVIAKKTEAAGALTKNEAKTFKDTTGHLIGDVSDNRVIWEDDKIVEDFDDIETIIDAFNSGDEDKTIIIPKDFDDTHMPDKPLVIDNEGNKLTITSEHKDDPSVMERPSENDKELFIVEEGTLITEDLILDGGSEQELAAVDPIIKVQVNGAYISNDGTLLRNNNNTSETELGGAIGNKGTTDLIGGKIDNCISKYGGGIFTEGTLNLTKIDIKGNKATDKGPGIYINDGSTKVANIPTVTDGIYSKGKLKDSIVISGELNSKAKLVILGSDSEQTSEKLVVATKDQAAGMLSNDEAKTFTDVDGSLKGMKQDNSVVFNLIEEATTSGGLEEKIDDFNNGDDDVIIEIPEGFDGSEWGDDPLIIDNPDNELIIQGENPDNPPVIERPDGNKDEMIIVSEGGLTLEDIIIDGGSEKGKTADGPLITVKTPAKFTLNSGAELRNNNNTSADKLGGAVGNAGVFNLNGGKVNKCESINGGGVYNTGTSNLKGGTIEANKGEGKGIFVQSGKINLSGNIKVNDGIFTKVKPRNVISITGTISDTSKIVIEGSTVADQMTKGTVIAKKPDDAGALTKNEAKTFVDANSSLNGDVTENNVMWEDDRIVDEPEDIKKEIEDFNDGDEDKTIIIPEDFDDTDMPDGPIIIDNEDNELTIKSEDPNNPSIIERPSENEEELFIVKDGTLITEDIIIDGGSEEGLTANGPIIKVLIKGKYVSKDGTVLRNNNNVSKDNFGGAIGNLGTTDLLGGNIDNCKSQYGGGVFNNGTLNASKTNIKNNQATDKGAGVYIGSGTMKIANVPSVTDGIYSKAKLSDALIIGGDLNSKARLMILGSDQDQLKEGTVISTKASDAGALTLDEAKTFTVSDNTLIGKNDGSNVVLGTKIVPEDPGDLGNAVDDFNNGDDDVIIEIPEDFDGSDIGDDPLIIDNSDNELIIKGKNPDNPPIIERPEGNKDEMIIVSEGGLTLEDIIIDGGADKGKSANGPLVTVKQPAKFTLNSGAQLRNNNNTSPDKLGGAVGNAGVFNLNGGKVNKCESINGGGVFNTGTSNLKSGSIEANKGKGKGIFVQAGKINLSGDINVKDGISTKAKPRNVLTIIGNISDNANILIEGSAVNGQMDKGAIVANKADTAGTLTKKEAKAFKNADDGLIGDVSGNKVIWEDDRIVEDFEDIGKEIDDFNNSDEDKVIEIPKDFDDSDMPDRPIIIDNEGKELEIRSEDPDDPSVIERPKDNDEEIFIIEDGTLITEDIIIDGGSEEGLTAKGPIIKVNLNGKYVSKEGTILRNNNNISDNNFGGAIGNLGTVDLLGGKINNCISQYGGGVFTDRTLDISKTSIKGNTATDKGAGIYIGSGTMKVANVPSVIDGIYSKAKLKDAIIIGGDLNSNAKLVFTGAEQDLLEAGTIMGTKLSTAGTLTSDEAKVFTVADNSLAGKKDGNNVVLGTKVIPKDPDDLGEAVDDFNNGDDDVIIEIPEDFDGSDVGDDPLIIDNPDNELIIERENPDNPPVIERPDGNKDEMIIVSEGGLTLEDIIIDGGADKGKTAEGPLVTVKTPAKFTLNDGAELRNNNNTSKDKLGGAVNNSGIFNLNGGKADKCESIKGGGVYNTGTTNLKSGSIETNKGEGKGIYVETGKIKLSGDPKVKDGIFINDELKSIFNISKNLTDKAYIKIEGSAAEEQFLKGTVISTKTDGVQLTSLDGRAFRYEGESGLMVGAVGYDVNKGLITWQNSKPQTNVPNIEYDQNEEGENNKDLKFTVETGAYAPVEIYNGYTKLEEHEEYTIEETADGVYTVTISKDYLDSLAKGNYDLRIEMSENLLDGEEEADDLIMKLIVTNTFASIDDVSVNKNTLPPNGGSVRVTLTGDNLSGKKVHVKAFEGNTETEIGGEFTYPESMILTFSENTHHLDKVYTIKAKLDGKQWISKTVNVTVGHELTPPQIVKVQPMGNDAELNGNLVIAFSEAIDKDSKGVVKLNGVTLEEVSYWANGGKELTIPYKDLEFNKKYVVAVSNFKDLAGNEMTLDSNFSFTTKHKVGIELSQKDDYDFKDEVSGYKMTPSALNVRVSNAGTNATSVLDIKLSGKNSDAFVLSKESLNSMLPGGYSTFNVKPVLGLDKGTYTATVIVTDNNEIKEEFVINFNVIANDMNKITEFTIENQIGSTYIDHDGSKITVVMPTTTDLSNLTPAITHEGISIDPESGVTQNFNSPKT